MKVLTRYALALILISVALVAIAADPDPQAPSTAPATTEALPTPGLEKPISPMMTEIDATMELRRSEIGELTARAAGTLDPVANQAIQEEIATIKQQTELDILGIQVRYARSNGNEELALKIEASIASILSPPVPVAPEEIRDIPNNNQN